MSFQLCLQQRKQIAEKKVAKFVHCDPMGWGKGVTMRSDDAIYSSLFSYIDLEKRIRTDHPLRVIRLIANARLKSPSLYSP